MKHSIIVHPAVKQSHSTTQVRKPLVSACGGAPGRGFPLCDTSPGLKACMQKNEGMAAEPKEAGAGEALKKKLSECRVFVVDDDPFNVQILQIFLRKSVKSLDTAQTAQEAISMISEAAKSGGYDFVLCDIRLDNGKTGFDVESEASKTSPNTRFIFVSAYDQSTIPDGKILLQKPIYKDVLFEFLNKLYGP